MTKKVKRVKRAEIEAEDGGGSVLLGVGIIGLLTWLWLRSRKAKEEVALAAASQFRKKLELEQNRSAAIKREGKPVSQMWEPQFSQHWRGA